jgi:thermitase
MKHNRMIRISLGIMSICAAFVGYGLFNSGTQSTTLASVHPTTDDSRDLVLGVAKSVKHKDGEKEKSVLFNDPFIQNKWGLEHTDARRAWEVTEGSKDIIVAVIDTGIDVNHKDLADNLWVNKGESGVDSRGRDKATNGIDDDGNGYIDDYHGWDFVHSSPTLTDNHGHGTHIAGIIGAKGGNGFGISGVSPNVSLMILKYYDPKSSNSNNLKNTVEAIQYAVKMHANIINYSGGGTDYSAEEFAAVKSAEKAGILFVAAAGNERSNSDETGKHYFPADYELSNIISVTAVSKEDKVLASSNYGVHTVDIAAPGENIYSSLPGNNFGLMTGTSQATAFVTGVAALVMANNRELDYSDVKKYILRNGDEYPTLLSKTGTARLLNSYKALTNLDKGVGLSGVVASNTATAGKDAFASEQNIRDPKLNTSAMNTNGEVAEPAEAFAMFGKEFLRAIGKGRVDATNTDSEVRRTR